MQSNIVISIIVKIKKKKRLSNLVRFQIVNKFYLQLSKNNNLIRNYLVIFYFLNK